MNRKQVLFSPDWWIAVLSLWLAAATAIAAPRTPWTIDSAASSTKALSAGAMAVQFDSADLDGWPIGEAGRITLPSGSTFEVRAERLEQHLSGNRSWIGKFDAAGQAYSVVVTYGLAGVTGEFMTPEGPVRIRGREGDAYVIDVGAAGFVEAPVLGPDTLVHPDEAGPDATDRGSAVALKATPQPQTTIDLLIAYTPAMVTRYGTTAGVILRLNDLVAKSNQAYADSEIATTIRLVHAVLVNYAEGSNNQAALTDMTPQAAANALRTTATTLRDRYGADIVALIRPFNYPGHVSCGIAFVGGFNGQGSNIGTVFQSNNNAFAVVSDGNDVNGSNLLCSDVSLPHELGHVMGNMHDRQTETRGGLDALGAPGAFTYAYGYVSNATFSTQANQNVCNPGAGQSCFGTVMSYITSGRLYRFSNPQLASCSGSPCGAAGIADTAQSMNNTRAGVASWRPTRLPFSGTRTGDGQTAAPTAAFAQPLIVTLRDALNTPVPGATVTFTAPGGIGPSASLSATTIVTDASGNAQVTATANAISGSYKVTATANPGFVSTVVEFNLTNATLAPVGVLSVAKAGTGAGTVTGSGISLINCGPTCASLAMPSGTAVTLTGTPNAGSTLTGWLGAPGCAGNAPCTVTVRNNMSVTATFAPNGMLVPANTFPSQVDPDLNGSSQALVDGLIILRHLFGLTGAPLTVNTLLPGAARTDPAQMTTFLNNILPQLDVDGDGRADALTDGTLYVRYLFGLRGPALVQGAVASGATRTTASQIETYLATIVN